MRYPNRTEAGAHLGALLLDTVAPFRSPPLVVGLPRGGVPVAREVARALTAPLDVWVSKKIGVPGHEEVGIGAVSENGVVLLDDALAASCGVGAEEIDSAVAQRAAEVAARAAAFRRGRGPPAVKGRTVIVVDDGVANGVTARAALRSLKAAGAAKLVLAVPVGSREGLEACAAETDLIVCPSRPFDFHAVGAHYQDFEQVEDDEVLRILDEAHATV